MALAIAVALVVVFVVIEIVVVGFVQNRVPLGAGGARCTSRPRPSRARSIAPARRTPRRPRTRPSATSATRPHGRERVGVVVHWNAPGRAAGGVGAGSSGEVEVLLERRDPDAGLLTDWGFVALTALGLVGTGGADLVPRERRRGAAAQPVVDDLADTAEAVAQGHLDVRAPESDDELGRLAQAFNRMTARLEQADARQREFLADVAHELRTPVTAIEGFATALGDGTAALRGGPRESAEFIRAEAARLRELVRDLQEITWLDLSPPVRAGARSTSAAAARSAVARLGLDAHVKGVALSAADGAMPALGDPEHVDTILTNLVTNAIPRPRPAGR